MSQHPTAQVPDQLFPDQEAEARWRARFAAPRVSRPGWAEDAPQRSLYISNVSGVWEVYSWDRDTDAHRQVTDRRNGTTHATLTPDGEHIWWFADTDGDEFGHWVREPWAGGAAPEAALPGTPDAYPAGLALGSRVVVLGTSTDDGTTVWVSRDGAPSEVVYQSEHDGGVGSMSKDESFLVISHSEHGDSRHPALRVLRTADGSTVTDKWDGKGKGLDALAFSPVPGDQRVLVLHERRGKEELLLWDVAADTEVELAIDLPGEIVGDWYPDGSALLISHTYQGRNTLHRYDINTGKLSTVDTARGVVSSAEVRPDGTVEYSWSFSAQPPAVRAISPDGQDRILLEPRGERAPGSVALDDAFVEGPGGTVHALVTRPEGQGPFPTLFDLHGGPHSADEDRFSAYRAAWVDAGFAVVQINYRGSTGYGSTWRDAIEGRPGLTELEDVAAVHDWAVASGLADPARCVVGGGSWGGFLTLLALGTQPERWAAGVASVPVADYVAAYEDEMEPLRAYDRALFGGSPEELPERYEASSPITYVDKVAAPVLVLAGENDPRCPIRQIDNYLDRLAAREASYEVYRYNAGHGSLVVAETVRQTATEIDFARRALAGR
ncbi:acetyl esterase/lipase [Crossiella equi]|uniref:Acetyl esterase/lipase n=1 Tax=Crossiella equi TaxID=130796 RepID=A0ABS5AFD0_9PSEU|nr:prolyl oligopeptidase family serine peptidase [Crossiella equi]MBP2475298.1 acetyl esterase/lipase [Crossiella equi]